MERFGARWLGPLVVVISTLVALPSGAAAAGWTCDASALRAQVLSAPAIEPAVANRGAADCRSAVAGGGALPPLPIGVSGSALTAGTALEGPLAGPPKEPGRAGTRTPSPTSAWRRCPSLPIALPEPDFSDFDAVNTPLGRVDLRPRSGC